MSVMIEGKKGAQRKQVFILCAKLEGKLLEKIADNTIDESCNEEDIKEWFGYYAKQLTANKKGDK